MASNENHKPPTNYSNTIIYKITCKDPNITDLYVGHTTDFVRRTKEHMYSCISENTSNHKCKLYETIRSTGGWSNWRMDIVAFFECDDLNGAKKKEQEYFISLKATLNSIEPLPNKRIPSRSPRSTNVDGDGLSKITSTKNHVNNAKYKCEKCKYSTKNSYDYIKHCNTRKHNIEIGNNQYEQMVVEYCCKNCNKQYKNRDGLWKHNKKCGKPVNQSGDISNIDTMKRVLEILNDIKVSNTAIHNTFLELQGKNCNSSGKL